MENKKHYIIFFLLISALVVIGLYVLFHWEKKEVLAPSENIFHGDAYVLKTPASWKIEPNDDGFSAYPDFLTQSSAAPACKIELSVFPEVSKETPANWVSVHLRGDPTLRVKEKSSEAIETNGAQGIRWMGTIDGASTTLIYLFGIKNIFEIVPAGGECDEDELTTFIRGFSLQ